MKVVLVFAALLAVALAEPCTNNQECVTHGITNCGNGYHVVCDNNNCVCTDGPTGGSCIFPTDCTCPTNRNPHCVDGACQCTRW